MALACYHQPHHAERRGHPLPLGAPLSVYLLSFVLTFESDRWYRRAVFVPLAAVMLTLCAFGLQDSLGSDLRTALPIW